jgi:DNA-binding IclR family transcriptional regulator
VVRTVHRAIEILELIAAGEGLGVSDIARALKLPKSSAHNILETLVLRRFLEKDRERNTYLLGSKLVELGRKAQESLRVQRVALPFLQDLNRDLDETVHLTILDNDEVLYVDCLESRKRLRAYSVIGVRAPLYCTAVGKAILAHMQKEQIERFVKTASLAAFTANTITSARRLREELSETMRRGYAIDNAEHEEHLRCVGAPIRDGSGHVFAALSVSGPSQRITMKLVPAVAQKVMAAAAGISERLGYRGAAGG